MGDAEIHVMMSLNSVQESKHRNQQEQENKASLWRQFFAACAGIKQFCLLKCVDYCCIKVFFKVAIGATGVGYGSSWSSPALTDLTGCEDDPELHPDGCTFDHEFTEEEGSWIGWNNIYCVYNSGICFIYFSHFS